MNIIQQGWQCPSCYLIFAPFVKSCDCAVLRIHDQSGPMTLNESLAQREVKDAWKKQEDGIAQMRRVVAQQISGDQPTAIVAAQEALQRLDATIAAVPKNG